MQGASFPERGLSSDEDIDYAERQLRNFDTASIGASTAAASQASSLASRISQKDRDYAFEIKVALGIKPGDVVNAEQGKILLNAVRA